VEYFDIILFAIIAGVLAVRLYKILGSKSKATLENNEASSQKITKINKKKEDLEGLLENLEVENGEGLDYLLEVDPKFNKDNFLSGANKALKMILNAKYKRDKKLLISFLEDDIFRLFEKSILDEEEKGHTIEKINLEIKDSSINEIKIYNNTAFIRVKFKYVEGLLIKNSDGSIFSDNANSLSEYNVNWTFSRPLVSGNPNWKLFGADQIH